MKNLPICRAIGWANPFAGTRPGKAVQIITLVILLSIPGLASAQGCRTGADALANAFVRINGMYTLFFGKLVDYVAQNRSHFAANGDSIVCARRLSQALTAGAINSFDPASERATRNMYDRLNSSGVGGYQAPPPSRSMMLLQTGQAMAWLARVLPPAAQGNFAPLNSPQTQMEQLWVMGLQMSESLLQVPAVRQVYLSMEGIIKASANAEYRQIMAWAREVN